MPACTANKRADLEQGQADGPAAGLGEAGIAQRDATQCAGQHIGAKVTTSRTLSDERLLLFLLSIHRFASTPASLILVRAERSLGQGVTDRGSLWRNTTLPRHQLISRTFQRGRGMTGLLQGGNRVRVNAQLISPETGAHLWADQFDISTANARARRVTIATIDGVTH